MESLANPDTIRLIAAYERARKHYTDLAYHNFNGHVLTTIQEAYRLIETLAAQNIHVDVRTVVYALLFHDAGFHLDHLSLGCKTKEELSARIAQIELTELGIDDSIIQQVLGCIRATQVDTEPQNNEETIVRLVDVGNVYGSMWEFARNGFLLAKEAGQRGITLPDTYQAYCSNTASFLQYYFGTAPVLTDRNGQQVALDSYYQSAQRNIARLQRIGRLPLRLINRAIPAAAQLAPQNWFENK